MPSAITFRAAIAVAAVLFLVAVAAIVNHFVQPANSHPFFGLKLGLLLILCALACGIWANYNRPASRA